MKYAVALGLIALALASRLLPHPDNFTPMLAVALFGGAVFTGGLACLVPLLAMLLSDLILGHEFGALSVFIYGSLALGALLGRSLATRRTLLKTTLVTCGASVLFFLVTNFGVWVLGDGEQALYPHTLGGLIECYWMGLPFFRNGLAGDLAWTALLFSAFRLASARLRIQPAVFG